MVAQAAAQSNGLVTDIFTNGAIHVLSDATAQATERTSLVARVPSTDGPDVARVARFGAFGAADGAVSHAWFLALDSVVGESGTTTETLLKVAADQLVYTPLFCVWFLSAFVLLEGREVGALGGRPVEPFTQRWLGSRDGQGARARTHERAK